MIKLAKLRDLPDRVYIELRKH